MFTHKLTLSLQARFAISSIDMWSPDDGTFNYPTFYRRIVDLFEMYQADKWMKETLAWWNKYFYLLSYHSMP